MQSTLERKFDLEQDNPRLAPIHHSKVMALVLSVVIALVITAGLLLTPPSYEAFVLINFSPTQVQNEWDLMKDETRVIDFEGQIRSRAVLTPALEAIKFGESSSGAGEDRFSSATEPSAEQRMVTLIEKFQRHLTAERIQHSSLLRISVKMKSPEMAAKAANAIAYSFFDLNRQQYLERSQKKINSIDREMAAVQEDLNNAINKQNIILKEKRWDDYNAELTTAIHQAAVLKQKLMELESFNTIDTGRNTVNNLSAASSDYSALLSRSEDGSLNQLIQKMDEVNTRYMQVKSRYKDNSPPVLQVFNEKTILNDSIKEYIMNRISSLSSQLKVTQKELQELLSAGPQIQSLQGAIDQGEKRYQELMGQRSAIRLQIDAAKKDSEGFGELRLLDRAVVPQIKTSLQRTSKIAVTAAASCLISFCLLMIIFEVWNQALLYLALQNSRSSDSLDKIL